MKAIAPTPLPGARATHPGRPAFAARPAAARLTPREAEVLHWVAEGKSNAAIAIILGLSPATVKGYVERILEKLGVENRTSAARLALASSAPGEPPPPRVPFHGSKPRAGDPPPFGGYPRQPESR